MSTFTYFPNSFKHEIPQASNTNTKLQKIHLGPNFILFGSVFVKIFLGKVEKNFVRLSLSFRVLRDSRIYIYKKMENSTPCIVY
jgi:hypothetical protein